MRQMRLQSFRDLFVYLFKGAVAVKLELCWLLCQLCGQLSVQSSNQRALCTTVDLSRVCVLQAAGGVPGCSQAGGAAELPV
jgi:hypothetical protein